MPRWQRLSSHLIFGLCALSGLAYFLKHEMFMALGDLPARSLLVTHGWTAALSLMVFGSVLPVHIRVAWHARRNRASGILMVLAMAGLMLSGLLLYYGSEEIHDAVLWTHWGLGFAAFLALPLHLILGHRANRLAARGMGD